MSLSSSGHDEKSLGRLLLELCVQLALTLLPIILCAMLPLPLSAALVLLHVLALGLAACTGREALARRISAQLSCAMIGFGIGVGRLLPGYWGIFAGIAAVVLGLAAVAAWERRLGLAEPEPGANAWGSGGPLLTPEGEPVRSFNWGEIAMGGPAWCDHLLPDGVVLEGLGSSLCFSSDGRYLAAAIPSRGEWGLVIFDRQLRRLHHCTNAPQFWELDAFDGEVLRGRHSPLVSNQAVVARLDTLLADARSEDFIAVGDLWLSPDRAAHLPAARDFPAPTGSHRLRGVPHLPGTLRELDNPLAPLANPACELVLDDEPSGLLLADGEAVIWREDGKALVCRARPVAELERGWSNDCWLWAEGEGWRLLDEPWQSHEGEPRLNLGAPLRLDGRRTWRAAYLDYAGTDRLGFGYGLYSIHGDSEILAGVDELGRALAGEHRLTQLCLGVSLDGAGRSGASLELQPMANGEVPRLEWLREGADGRQGAFACRIGDWLLDGEWCLDHRVSDCGRYLALVAFAEAPAVPHRLVVADVRERRLLALERPLAIARLHDFREGIVSLAHVLGRLPEGCESIPLQRFTEAAPDARRAAAFMAAGSERFYYEVARVAFDPDALRLVPTWRLAECPPVANALGDFVLPAPGGMDAAWLFGCENRFADSYLREQEPRMGGCLLTASGCAIADLGPAMIWSDDGRFLALTRFGEYHDPRAGSHPLWHLLVLDTHEHRLYRCADPIGLMPRFEGFDGAGLCMRVHAYAHEVEDDAGEPRRFSLDELLALRAEPLRREGGLWLPDAERERIDLWQHLDSTHLDPWRAP
ncbi:hypothetical protein [Pseudomonas tohonis]|uniref:hypothetical protein n=1 Tax=Pseudomonas tohonis TaxID=2725477 RepID=UPI001F18D933|nr:hypothetical protein [Pseudomonas tohonis]